MKSRELMAACLNPGADTYMYRRVLRELVAKTDYATCIIQSGRTYYEWNRNLRPTLYDLTLRLEGGMHEVTNGFWSYENSHLLQPLSAVRIADARISFQHPYRRTRLPGALRAQLGQTAVPIPDCGRTDGTTHQSPINIKK